MTILKSCDGKVAHDNELSAQYYLDELTSNRNAEIQKCKYCEKYHIGKAKGKKNKTPKRFLGGQSFKEVFKDYKIKIRKMRQYGFNRQK